MVCPECNKQVPEGFTVCPHCGLSMKSINTINQQLAFKDAQAKVRGEKIQTREGGAVSSRIKKRSPGVPKTSDYIRLVAAMVTFILMFTGWYSVHDKGDQIGTNTIFGTGKGGLFTVAMCFGLLSILFLLIMIINTFVNFGKLFPSLKKVDTLRLTAMLYAVSYVLALIFALIATIVTANYSLTVLYLISLIAGAFFSLLTFTSSVDKRFK